MTESPKNDQSTLVFTATYCEADNINEWHQRVRLTFPNASILVVDDNSPDGTARQLEALAKQDPLLEYVVRPGKLGLGSAHRLAMTHALDNNFAVLATLDADLSHQPEQLPRLVRSLQESDFVIGTRSGEGTSDYTGLRRIASIGANTLARLLIPTGLTEYTSSMRVFNRRALEALSTDVIKDEGYAFFMEVIYRLWANGLVLSEEPIDFVDRRHGTSKIPRNQIFTSGLVLMRLTLDRVSHPKVRAKA